ncbi:MAG: hypothetical protein ACLRX6_03200 [Limosilactobacillus pontis]|uniref:hypothetical protein n=1 Tax=Limosilactobacillus pontis TaxID=35787 RepID=UPI0039A2D537
MKYLMIFATVVTAVLFGMKLAGAVACTWLVVFSPLLIALGIWFAIVLFALVVIGIYALIAILMKTK